ncbi:hypothetical protein AYI69_g9469, partial [Smittium culicis]
MFSFVGLAFGFCDIVSTIGEDSSSTAPLIPSIFLLDISFISFIRTSRVFPLLSR